MGTIYKLFANMFKINGHIQTDNRLHLTRTPIWAFGVCHKIPKFKIQHVVTMDTCDLFRLSPTIP